jgi:hypothetical protein
MQQGKQANKRARRNEKRYVSNSLTFLIFLTRREFSSLTIQEGKAIPNVVARRYKQISPFTLATFTAISSAIFSFKRM